MLDEVAVKKIAKLARIRLSEDELKNYTGEINGILDWIEQLQQVDTDGVVPMAGVGQYTLRAREDKVTDGDAKDDVLANAPNHAYDCFTVPKVIE